MRPLNKHERHERDRRALSKKFNHGSCHIKYHLDEPIVVGYWIMNDLNIGTDEVCDVWDRSDDDLLGYVGSYIYKDNCGARSRNTKKYFKRARNKKIRRLSNNENFCERESHIIDRLFR